MNANANKAPFKQSSASRSASPVSLLTRELITRSSAEGEDEGEGRQPAVGRSLHSLSVEI